MPVFDFVKVPSLNVYKMKKASFGRRSSIAGRNTFDGNDLRFKLFIISIMQCSAIGSH